MRDPVGHVTVNERIPSQRFHRFVDEKIKDWMKDHQLEDAPAEYEVAFFDEDPLGEISCLVVIHSGEHLWRSWETADNPRLALRRSLEHLNPTDEEEGEEATEEVEMSPRADKTRTASETSRSNRPIH